MKSRISITTILLVALLAAVAAQPADLGYENLFFSQPQHVPRTCLPLPGAPAWLRGSFILPAVAQFEVGAQAFTGELDGFGKLHRFEVNQGQACFEGRIMDTAFYNMSMAEGKVAPSILFSETAPPTGYLGFQVRK